jgi:hypothetical protein
VLIAVIGLIAWSLFGETVEQKVVLATEQMGGVGTEGSRLPSAGGGGGSQAGQSAAGVGTTRSGSDDVEVAQQPGVGSSMSAGGPPVAGDGTEAAGVVSRSGEGGVSVYSAPGADEDDSGVWFTLLGIIVLFLLGIVFFAKIKGRAAR